MTAAYRLKGIGWFGGCVAVVLGFYLVSLQVAAERKKLEGMDRKIEAAERDIRALETEFDTRANLAQLEKWNGETLALAAPTAGPSLDLLGEQHDDVRSAVVLPYVTEHEAFASPDAAARYHSDWWWLNLAFALALSLALVAIAAGLRIVLPAQAWLAAPLMLGAAITPPLLAADFVRRWFYKQERAWWAAAVSALFFVALGLVPVSFVACLLLLIALAAR